MKAASLKARASRMHSYKPVQSWLALQVFYPPDSSVFYQTPAAVNFHSADVSPCAIFLDETLSRPVTKLTVEWGRNTTFLNKSPQKSYASYNTHIRHFNWHLWGIFLGQPRLAQPVTPWCSVSNHPYPEYPHRTKLLVPTGYFRLYPTHLH